MPGNSLPEGTANSWLQEERFGRPPGGFFEGIPSWIYCIKATRKVQGLFTELRRIMPQLGWASGDRLPNRPRERPKKRHI